VHSLKDLPTDEVPGLCLAAVPEREEVADGLIARNGLTFESLPKGARIGTGSARRIAQLRMHRPDLKMLDIRGNVDTRLKKLEAGEYDAIVLAIAGLKRLGLADCVTEQLDLRLMLPAVGQAALGLETRHDDSDVIEVVERLNHPPTYQAVIAERSMLRALRGGCIAPVAAHAIVSGANITLQSRVLAMDGTSRVETTLAGPSKAPDAIGLRAAELLELGGAREMIAASRKID
jgi:hydroxymethylbilane synthase